MGLQNVICLIKISEIFNKSFVIRAFFICRCGVKTICRAWRGYHANVGHSIKGTVVPAWARLKLL